jgi:hypothetical protein
MTFSGPGGIGPARVRLEQIKPNRFVLLEGFRYRSDAGAEFELTPATLGETDLTSVPFGFRWFVNSYGRHTLPALLHDCLVRPDCAREVVQPDAAPPSRAQADDVFLEALRDQGVPFVRRHLMWASVVFNTRFTRAGALGFALMCIWVAAAASGTVSFFGGIWWWFPWLPIIAALAPIPFALLWRTKWRAGIWFGYGVVFLAPAGLAVHASYAAYWALESFIVRTNRPPPWREF